MFGDRFTHSFSRVVLLLATECFFNKGQCLMCNLDKAYLMGLGSLPPDLGSYLDKLFDENTLQSAEAMLGRFICLLLSIWLQGWPQL
jgi:hypothetical protein